MKLTLPEKPKIFLLVQEIEAVSESDIKALLPKDPRFWNVISLQVLRDKAEEVGKDLTFVAQNERGKNLLVAFHGKDLRGEKIGTSGSFFSRIVPRFSIFSGTGGIGLWKGLAGVVGGLVVLLGAGIFAFLYFSEATVNLRLNTTTLVKNKEVTLSPSVSEADVGALVIPGIPIKVTESGTFEGETSGTKEVGSNAEGDVTVYNYDTANEKEFSKGDVLVVSGEEDMQFTLSESVEIDPATSTIDPEDDIKKIEPEKNSVVVTAVDIGSQYNIEEDTTLCFEKLDDDLCDANEDNAVVAVTAEDFSGGDSKEVLVVTAEDQNKVLEDGIKELASRCEQSLSGKLVGDQKLTGKAVETAVLEKEFTPAVGEEADVVQLRLQTECQSLAYSEDALYRVLSEKVKDLVPEGFQQRREEADIEILTAEKADDEIKIQARISAELTPQVDTAQIQEDLAGRAFSELDAYFSTKDDINSYSLSFWPPVIPNFLGRFPLKKERITVRVEDM